MSSKNKIKVSNKTFFKNIISGKNLADRITQILGSWGFIMFQSVVLLVWLVLNVTAWVRHWDPYPFILLNLALSFQAAYAAPIILMSQNRMAEKDRQKAQMDLITDRKAEKEIENMQKDLSRLERKVDQIAKNISKL